MKLIEFAGRNVLRNTRRSLLAAASVLLSILMIVVLNGLTEGFLDSLVRNYTKNETGHVNISTAAFRARERFMPVDEYIPGADGLAEKSVTLLAGAGIRAKTAERIRFGVILSAGENTKTALGIAGEAEKERSLLMLDRSVLPGGTYCSEPGTVILGDKLARDLGLSAGDLLKIVTRKADGGLGYKKLLISGIFRTGVNSLDGTVFQMGLADARELLGMEGGSQSILVMLEDYKQAGRAAAVLASAPEFGAASGLSVLPWTKIGEYPRLIAMARAIYIWVWVFVAFLGAFIIANVLMMVILERRRETGILMSMGMPRREILSLFVLEGAMIGAAGSTAGSLLGTLFNLALSKKGFDMTSAMAAMTWPMDNVIHPRADIFTALAFIAMGTLVAAIVSWLPARNASRMNPVDAIRSV